MSGLSFQSYNRTCDICGKRKDKADYKIRFEDGYYGTTLMLHICESCALEARGAVLEFLRELIRQSHTHIKPIGSHIRTIIKELDEQF